MSFVRIRKGRLHARERRALVRAGLEKRQGFYRCHYCAIAMLPGAVTWDHKVPVIAGGDTRIGNLLPSCKACNAAKGSMPYKQFKQAMLPVKQARRAGRDIPHDEADQLRVAASMDVAPPAGRAQRRKDRKAQIAAGFTRELLFDCMRVHALRGSGRVWSEVAQITGYSVAAVRVMEQVGSMKHALPGKRRELAERLGLIELVKPGDQHAAVEQAHAGHPSLNQQTPLQES